MFRPVMLLSLLVAVGGAVTASDGERLLALVPGEGFPRPETIVVYPTGQEKPVLRTDKIEQPVALPGEGPYDVRIQSKGGLEVTVATKLTVKAGTKHELKLADILGAVEVIGDNLPRATQVILTAPGTPGPDEKGYTPRQTATGYRMPMLVPPGVYAVWVKPANGARHLKIDDKARVLAGRITRVGE